MKANSKRVNALIKLGVHLKNYNPDDEYYGLLKKQVHQAIVNNGWFTAESIRETFSSWGNVLVQDTVEKWLTPYSFSEGSPSKTIALILAGNIPMVGFHDIICVLA